MLELRVRKELSHFTLTADVTLTTRASGLFGASGSGKTTLLNIIAGLASADEGRIQLDDLVLWDSGAKIDLPPERRGIGYVFQEARLFPHLRVRENLLYGPRARRIPVPTERFDAVVELLGIGPLLTRYPRTLSGGEKQRVAIGRAVLSQPRLLLMDEPLASLDLTRRADILGYVRRLRDELHIAMLYVSHSAEEIAALTDEVVVIETGRVVAVGRPDDVLLLSDGHRPLHALAQSALLTARVVEHLREVGLTLVEHERGRLKVPLLDVPPGASVRLRVHARDVVLTRVSPESLSIRNVLTGTIQRIEPTDVANVRVTLKVGADELTAIITRDAVRELQLRDGEDIFVLIKASSIEASATNG